VPEILIYQIICILKQIQWIGKKHLWISSLGSGKSSMDEECFFYFSFNKARLKSLLLASQIKSNCNHKYAKYLVLVSLELCFGTCSTDYGALDSV